MFTNTLDGMKIGGHVNPQQVLLDTILHQLIWKISRMDDSMDEPPTYKIL